MLIAFPRGEGSTLLLRGAFAQEESEQPLGAVEIVIQDSSSQEPAGQFLPSKVQGLIFHEI